MKSWTDFLWPQYVDWCPVEPPAAGTSTRRRSEQGQLERSEMVGVRVSPPPPLPPTSGPPVRVQLTPSHRTLISFSLDVTTPVPAALQARFAFSVFERSKAHEA